MKRETPRSTLLVLERFYIWPSSFWSLLHDEFASFVLSHVESGGALGI